MWDHEWLESLKEGDLVLIKFGFNPYNQARIKRTTKTQIIVEGQRFRRQDGFLVGGDAYTKSHIAKPTPKLLERIRRNKLIDRIKNLDWTNYSTSLLAQVLSLLSKLDKETEKETEEPHDQSPNTK